MRWLRRTAGPARPEGGSMPRGGVGGRARMSWVGWVWQTATRCLRSGPVRDIAVIRWEANQLLPSADVHGQVIMWDTEHLPPCADVCTLRCSRWWSSSGGASCRTQSLSQRPATPLARTCWYQQLRQRSQRQRGGWGGVIQASVVQGHF